MDYINQFLTGDCIEVMRKIPAGVIDLVVTSPPYNLGGVSKGGKWKTPELSEGYNAHDDNMEHGDYVTWQRACLTEMMRLIPDNGAIFYNHKWRVQGGLLQDRSDILSGFPVRQIIIWQRAGGINFNPGYFLPTYEVIYLIAKPQFELADNASSLGDVWSIKQESGSNLHPAPFPVALSDRIIKSTNAQVILDPFGGSGTVAVSAQRLGLDFVYIDNSVKYTKMAKDRLNFVVMPKNGSQLSLFGATNETT